MNSPSMNDIANTNFLGKVPNRLILGSNDAPADKTKLKPRSNI